MAAMDSPGPARRLAGDFVDGAAALVVLAIVALAGCAHYVDTRPNGGYAGVTHDSLECAP
jgi:hypothetical protein